jgi:hypothetical protein
MKRFAGLIAAATLVLPIASKAQDLPRALIQFAANTTSTSAPTSTRAPATAARPAIQHHKLHSANQQALSAQDRRSVDAKERRETEALNHLQAAGYSNFSNVAADGRDYRATVTKDGQPMVVRVNPERGSVEAVR